MKIILILAMLLIPALALAGPPTITSIEPTQITTGSGPVMIVIRGTDLDKAKNLAVYDSNGNYVGITSYVVISPTEIHALVDTGTSS